MATSKFKSSHTYPLKPSVKHEKAYQQISLFEVTRGPLCAELISVNLTYNWLLDIFKLSNIYILFYWLYNHFILLSK